MITERRFLTGFRSADADTPGLVQEDDGTVWLVAPDGTRTQISGGGSSSPLNWCRAQLALDGGGNFSIVIDSQSGTDFSVGIDNGQDAIFTAAGGWFQAGAYVGPPSGVSWDMGVTTPRWLNFALITGSRLSPNPFHAEGLDCFLPMTPDGQSPAAITVASLVGLAAPGETAVTNFNINVTGAAGGDVFPANLYNGFANLDVWQVPAAT